jgi:hypothetical protein
VPTRGTAEGQARPPGPGLAGRSDKVRMALAFVGSLGVHVDQANSRGPGGGFGGRRLPGGALVVIEYDTWARSL